MQIQIMQKRFICLGENGFQYFFFHTIIWIRFNMKDTLILIGKLKLHEVEKSNVHNVKLLDEALIQ